MLYPSFNPIAFSIGSLSVHWYGLMYLFSFLIAWGWLRKQWPVFSDGAPLSEVDDLVFYLALGVVLGGRVGYMLFYTGGLFFKTPWMIFKIWEGGMSFHGGLLGVGIALWRWSLKKGHGFLKLTDLIAPIAPIGLALGRLGNAINGFLMGRITEVPWGVVYPQGGPWKRHPISVYEFLMEGVLLWVLLYGYTQRKRPTGSVTAFFLCAYAIARCVCELFRAPDAQYGFLAWGWLTMGQLLSFFMFMAGLLLFRVKVFLRT